MATDSHAPIPPSFRCPSWCTGEPHDIDETYGVHGVHHDSDTLTIALDPDDGSRIHLRVSQFVPADDRAWPPRVEVEADLSEDRRWAGPLSVWLSPQEARALAAGLVLAALIL